jgi:hypothetical protein
MAMSNQSANRRPDTPARVLNVKAPTISTVRPCTRRPAKALRSTGPNVNTNFDKDEFLSSLASRTPNGPIRPVKRYIYKVPPPVWASDAIEMHPVLVKLYADYYDKGIKAPIEARVKAFTSAGYPPHIIEEMVLKDRCAIEAREANDEFVFSIFGTSSNKKESAPKKKTLRQLLHMKRYKAIKPDEDSVVVEL